MVGARWCCMLLALGAVPAAAHAGALACAQPGAVVTTQDGVVHAGVLEVWDGQRVVLRHLGSTQNISATQVRAITLTCPQVAAAPAPRPAGLWLARLLEAGVVFTFAPVLVAGVLLAAAGLFAVGWGAVLAVASPHRWALGLGVGALGVPAGVLALGFLGVFGAMLVLVRPLSVAAVDHLLR